MSHDGSRNHEPWRILGPLPQHSLFCSLKLKISKVKLFFSLLLLTFVNVANAGNIIEWDRNYQLQLSDFQSPATQIGKGTMYSLQPASTFNFSYSMTNGEFMFTKNFNNKVECIFQRDAAALQAPDSSIAADLLQFARFEFDLSELYARKFRKQIYERKGAFSDAGFFRPIHEAIQKEYAARHMTASQDTDLGRNREKLAELHKEILAEIDQMPDFCKTCKPSKKKK